MKRHEFELIAAALQQARPTKRELCTHDELAGAHGAFKQWAADCRAIADALARGSAPGGNRAFDRELFLRNAGVQES